MFSGQKQILTLENGEREIGMTMVAVDEDFLRLYGIELTQGRSPIVPIRNPLSAIGGGRRSMNSLS